MVNRANKTIPFSLHRHGQSITSISIGCPQYIKFLSKTQMFYIHGAGVVSGPLWLCARIRSLNFRIVFFVLII